MATLKKMTRMGADVRQIAKLLQAKAPEGHMLAYITPEEAALLKAQGGSGKPHADTGIPSFEDESMSFESNFPTGDVTTQPVETAAAPVGTDLPPAPAAAPAPAPAYNPAAMAASYARPEVFPQIVPTAAPTVTAGPTPTGVTTYGPDYGKPPVAEPAPTEPGYMDKLKDYLSKGDRLEKLGVGGLQSLAATLMANKAAKQGQAAKEEMQSMARPYQQQGQQLSAAAQRGELTPAAQQQMQTVQAQLAQQASSRGGVGAQQSAAQIEAFRNNLLQQQYDYGLKLSGIGDNIALGAIKSGLQADQYVQQLSSNYMNNIMRTLYGVAPQTAGAPAQPTPQA
jgi:hypothetical protein